MNCRVYHGDSSFVRKFDAGGGCIYAINELEMCDVV